MMFQFLRINSCQASHAVDVRPRIGMYRMWQWREISTIIFAPSVAASMMKAVRAMPRHGGLRLWPWRISMQFSKDIFHLGRDWGSLIQAFIKSASHLPTQMTFMTSQAVVTDHTQQRLAMIW